jgi:hypothetical protein
VRRRGETGVAAVEERDPVFRHGQHPVARRTRDDAEQRAQREGVAHENGVGQGGVERHAALRILVGEHGQRRGARFQIANLDLTVRSRSSQGRRDERGEFLLDAERLVVHLEILLVVTGVLLERQVERNPRNRLGLHPAAQLLRPGQRIDVRRHLGHCEASC